MEHRQQPWVHRSWHIRCSRDKGAGAPSEPPRTETSILRKIPTRIPTISSQLASLRSSLTGATLMPHPSTCRNGTFCDTVRRAGKLLGLLLIPRCRDRDPGGPPNSLLVVSFFEQCRDPCGLRARSGAIHRRMSCPSLGCREHLLLGDLSLGLRADSGQPLMVNSTVFVIQVDAALNTAAGSTVHLINGAQASNVFWQVNGAAGTGATSDRKS